MDTEFHYWITGLIACRAGFDRHDAKTIACASEFVDENDVCLEVKDRRGGRPYRNFISQTMNILKPKHELFRIYPIFHFIPGEPDAHTARRRDGKMHRLNTTPNSDHANALLDAAFKANPDIRLYRIGIATHGFVDSWAHQNFVGWYDSFNNIGLDPKPDIGHADGEHHPDWVNHLWVDSRLVDGDINNGHRFLSAAEALFRKYCAYLKTQHRPDNSAQWAELEKELLAVSGTPYSGNEIAYREMRVPRYKEALPWQDDFDERRWFDAAIKTEVHGMRDSHEGLVAELTVFRDEHFWREDVNKEDTAWYQFQEAVKEHEAFAIDRLSPTFKLMGEKLAEV